MNRNTWPLPASHVLPSEILPSPTYSFSLQEISSSSGRKQGRHPSSSRSAGGRRTEYTVYVAGNDRGMSSAIQDAIGYPKVHVQMIKDRVMLRGKVENQYEHDTALKIAGLYTGGDGSGVIDLLEMEHPSRDPP